MSRAVAVPSPTLPQRYWAKVYICGADECWPWTGYRQKHGHGSIWVGYNAAGQVIMEGAHRVAWELAYGTPPGDLHVRHRCDNPPCQNPDHLELGTHLENMQDMVARKRYHVVVGSKHGKSKITEDDVREMRALYSSGLTQKALAKAYGVTQANVSLIVRREAWQHVEDAV